MGRAPAPTDQDQRHGQRSRQRTAPLIAYFDTSAFTKLFVAEPGSPRAAAAWEAADRRVSTDLLYVESRSALAAAVRAQRISRRQLAGVRERLEALSETIDGVHVDEDLVRRAGDLAEEHALRGCDAVHLASAEQIADAETVFVGADADLLTAAQALGLGTVSV